MPKFCTRNKETFNRLAPAFFLPCPPPSLSWLLEDVKNSSKTPGSCCIITDGRTDFYALRGVEHLPALEGWIWHLSARERWEGGEIKQDVNGNQLQASPSQRERCCLWLLPAACRLCHPLRLAPCNTLGSTVNTLQKTQTDTPSKKPNSPPFLSPAWNIFARDSERPRI